MATLTATAAASTSQAQFHVTGPVWRTVEYSLNGLTLSAGDVIQMCKVPSGARIIDMVLTVDGTGAAGVQSYTIGSMGDGNAAGRYLGTLSVVTSLVQRLALVGGFGYSYSAEDTIDITIGTITSGTAATATVRLTLAYTNNP